ncbi:hypothetical protein NDU88_004272 [Pleurodeles waltl]|uniref:Secreted protein n=1 Tax=Pleurodeles waltl TaxID=8319 RepID=A0AAV7NS14_PLEWA|nr:hypothetical protein NDU88_004272 [Pleurodeles waltl]
MCWQTCCLIQVSVGVSVPADAAREPNEDPRLVPEHAEAQNPTIKVRGRDRVSFKGRGTIKTSSAALPEGEEKVV